MNSPNGIAGNCCCSDPRCLQFGCQASNANRSAQQQMSAFQQFFPSPHDRALERAAAAMEKLADAINAAMQKREAA